MSYIPVPNQSVSGTVGASVIGLTPVNVSNFPATSGSVVAFQGTNPFVITGSVQASLTPAANQSISGAVSVSNFPANQSVSGAVTVAFPTTQNISGSVAAWIQSSNASVITVGTAVANQSVSGTVNVGNTITINPVSVYGAGSVASYQAGAWSVSIIGSLTPPANQSVSGTVQVNNGSVVAFQGTSPWIVTGSVQANLTPAANQSVSGTVGSSIIGTVPVTGFPTNPSISGTVLVNNGSVVSFQGGAWSVSIIGSLTPPANQSVSGAVSVSNLPANQSISGTVAANIQGSVATVIIGGSIAASFTPPANQSVSGAVSVSNLPANQSVSGTLGSSVIGTVPVTQVTNPWTVVSSLAGGIFPISGSVAATVTNFPTTQNVSGSVAAFINGNVTVVSSIAGGIFPISGSVAATITNTTINISGSVAAFLGGSTNASIITVGTAAANQSVSGTVGASIIGNVPIIVQSSVAVAIVSGSVAVTVTPPANQSVSGTVQTQVQASVAVVIIGGSILTSSTANQSISGSVGIVGNPSISGTVLIGNAPSIYGNISGSVVAFQGTTPWTIGSIYGNISGSVFAVVSGLQGASISGQIGASIIGLTPVGATQSGTWKTSIASNYATGSASIVSGVGDLILGVRNDTLASIYGTNGQYSPITVGPVGEQIFAIAPFNKQVTGTASCFTGVGQPMLASVSGSYIYLKSLQVANASANNAYLTIYSSGVGSVMTGSIIGYTVAPANGGSNIVYELPIRGSMSNPISASVSGVASVYLSAQGFYSTT